MLLDLRAHRDALALLLAAIRKALVKQARYDYTFYVAKIATQLSLDNMRALPAKAWSTIKHLLAVTGKHKFSPNRSFAS